MKKTSSPKQEYLKPTWSDKAFTNTVETRTFHSVNERGDWNKVYSPYNINMTNKQFTKHFVHIKKWFLSEWNSIAKRVFIRSVFNMWSWKKKIYEYEKFTKCWCLVVQNTYVIFGTNPGFKWTFTENMALKNIFEQ